MKALVRKMWRFFHDQDGPTATEYAVLLVLIVFICLAVLQLIGAFVADTTRTVADSLPVGATAP